MVKGIAHRSKRYVEVYALHHEDGRVIPLSITWDYGKRFEIDEIKDIRRAASLKTGGDGLRYTVRIGSHLTYLFFENPRWFVEEKIVEIPDYLS